MADVGRMTLKWEDGVFYSFPNDSTLGDTRESEK